MFVAFEQIFQGVCCCCTFNSLQNSLRVCTMSDPFGISDYQVNRTISDKIGCDQNKSRSNQAGRSYPDSHSSQFNGNITCNSGHSPSQRSHPVSHPSYSTATQGSQSLTTVLSRLTFVLLNRNEAAVIVLSNHITNAFHERGQTSRVGLGRVESGLGDSTQPAKKLRCRRLTRPDPTREISKTSSPDPLVGSRPI